MSEVSELGPTGAPMPDKTTVAGELPVVAHLSADGLRLMHYPRNDDPGSALVHKSDATAALAQKDGEIAALKAEHEAFVKRLEAFANAEYIAAMSVAKEDAAKGQEYRLKAGKFGEAEFSTHQRMNRHFGAHFGIFGAIKAARSALGSQA